MRTPVDARRAALVEAAVRVVSARGLSAASTRAIVAEAGMSLASFHYAFESRDELLDLLITEVLAKEEKAVLPEQLEGRTLAELLHAGLTGYLDHLRADPAREQAMLELTQFALRARPELARDQYAQYTRIATAALEMAAHHTRSRWTVPVPTAARLLISFTDGITLTWLVDRDDALAESVVTAAAAALAQLAAPLTDAE
ncbi:TetR/AcrR family transcriptional regulator [Microbacterium sp. NPDC058389]|uniref:TetR/AcrR family transcriptional regulator n=1 Tax=Microbacterium sp. NPDC058389 TaxID=3346475 RepID=UPI0036577A1C